MKTFCTLLCATFIAVAAMAQSRHPVDVNSWFEAAKGMPRINPTFETLQRAHTAQLHKAMGKAGGQAMPIDTADPVKLYTNAAYSWEGHYDYYFSFANSEDDFYFPMIFFDLYLPTSEGLVEGTYKMSEGTVGPNLMLMANYNDYVYYYYGYTTYEWTDATISLTKGGGEDVWTVDFSVTSTDDYTYTFSFTGALPVELDDYDPNEEGEEPETTYTYDYEPTQATQMDIVFEVPDVSDGYVAEYGIYDIYLDSKQQDANGRFYEGHLYLLTNETKPKADFYPVNSSEAIGTFLASRGCPAGSSSDVPCFIRTYDDTYIYDSWYIVAGYINVGYDTEGQMTLDGNVESYNGSTIHITTVNFSSDEVSEGIFSPLAAGDNLQSAKELRGGQFYIRKGTRTYNVLGQRSK